MNLSASQVEAFAQIARSDRSFGRFVRDLVGLGETLKSEQIKANPASIVGVRQAVDEMKILMALRGAKDEVELEMKSAMLIGHPPLVHSNCNLSTMLEAALLADAQRLTPGSLPVELRAKFRS